MRAPLDCPTKLGETPPLGMNLCIDAFEDQLFDNDEIHFVSDDPMSQDGSSQAAPTDSFANPHVNDVALATLCQNLHSVEITSKKRSHSF